MGWRDVSLAGQHSLCILLFLITTSLVLFCACSPLSCNATIGSQCTLLAFTIYVLLELKIFEHLFRYGKPRPITFFPITSDESFFSVHHLGLTAKPISYVSLFFKIITTLSGMYQFLLQCDKKNTPQVSLETVVCFIHAPCPACVASILWSMSSSFIEPVGCYFLHLESWWLLWQLKRDRVIHPLTLQGIWLIVICINLFHFFFFTKASPMAIPDFCQSKKVEHWKIVKQPQWLDSLEHREK